RGTDLGVAEAALAHDRAKVGAGARRKMSIFSLVVAFDFRPGLSQIASEPAADENIEMFVAPRVRMFDVAGSFDAAKMLAVAGAVAAENDHGAAVVIARAPNPVTLMIADRFRKTEPWSEEIDRAGFAEVV